MSQPNDAGLTRNTTAPPLTPSPQTGLRWMWPVFGYDAFSNITAEYHDVDYQNHIGIDTGIPVGTKLVAPIGGTVKSVGYRTDGWGRAVEIVNGDYRIILGHLSALADNLKPGDEIRQGTLLGLSGGDLSDPYRGYSSGPHLDMTIYYRGQPVDPRTVMGGGTSPGMATNRTTFSAPQVSLPTSDPLASLGKIYNDPNTGITYQITTQGAVDVGNGTIDGTTVNVIGSGSGYVSNVDGFIGNSLAEGLLYVIRALLGVPQGQNINDYVRDNWEKYIPRVVVLIVGLVLLFTALTSAMNTALAVKPQVMDTAQMVKSPVTYMISHPKQTAKAVSKFSAVGRSVKTIRRQARQIRSKA